MKVGRNDLCPCGSGRKFKKCHLGIPTTIFPSCPTPPERPQIPPDLIVRARESFEKQKANEEERIKKFGKVLPVMHAQAWGGQMVGVNGRIYKTDEKSTFTNFLFDHGLNTLGDDWREEQNSLPLEDRHPLFVLHCRANEYTSSQPVRPEGYVTVVPNGPLRFCEKFYYDLYTVDHNNELRPDLLHRLRNKDQFQGAAHELFVEATCLRAGFTIVREQFTGLPPKNVEFIAVHNETGQHLSIEAKSRHRYDVLGCTSGTPESDPDTRFGKLINDAAAKDPHNPLVIFVDTNLPPDSAESFYKPVSLEPVVMSKRINQLAFQARRNGIDPFNLLVFTNHPQHYGDNDHKAPKDHWGAVGAREPRVKVTHEKALRDLLDALDVYGNVPTDFPKLIPGTNIPE